MTKIEGPGVGAGSESIRQRHGSEDPDPYQNVTVCSKYIYKPVRSKVCRIHSPDNVVAFFASVKYRTHPHA
jgi:hypothetical protein